MILLKAGSTKLDGDEPQEEGTIATILKKLRSTTVRCEEPTA
jgi:hypothetical protein